MRSYSKGWLLCLFKRLRSHQFQYLHLQPHYWTNNFKCNLFAYEIWNVFVGETTCMIFIYCRAQDFYAKNMFAMMAGKLCGLLAVLAVPSILKILMCTNASSTPFTAYKRYLETIFHTLAWYDSELKPGSRWVKRFFFFFIIHHIFGM